MMILSLNKLETILIKSNKKTLVDELEEKVELAKTRSTVLEKQETRVKESLKETRGKNY